MTQSAAAQQTPASGNPSFGKGLAQGLGVVALIYAGLAGWLVYQGPQTAAEQAEKRISRSVLVQHTAQQSPVATPADTTLLEEILAEEPPVEDHGLEETPVEAAPHAEAAPVTPVEESPVAAAAHDPTPEVAATVTTTALTPAPVEGVYERKDGRILPVVNKKTGETPFTVYRKPFDRAAANGKPIIALIVTDMGVSESLSGTVLSTLPTDVTLAVSPYAATPDLWINEGRARGHETWLVLPTEPKGYPAADPGPQTLLIGAPESQNTAKLLWVLGRTTGYAGVVSTPDSAFTASSTDLRPVAASLYNRGLGLVDAAQNPSAVAASMALGQNAAYAPADILIDRTLSRADIEAALAQLESRAAEKGAAIGIIRTTNLGINSVKAWVETLEQKGIVLAPLSAIAGPAL